MKAFPLKGTQGSIIDKTEDEYGMDLRDYFAAKAMQALLSKYGAFTDDISSPNAYPLGKENVPDITKIATYSYWQADAMMKAREQ